MKPVALVERAIRNSSKSRDIVLDPFGGSGSTLIACEKTGRQARLIELDPKYVDTIILRWQEFSGGTAVLDGDGRSYEEIADGRRLRHRSGVKIEPLRRRPLARSTWRSAPELLPRNRGRQLVGLRSSVVRPRRSDAAATTRSKPDGSLARHAAVRGAAGSPDEARRLGRQRFETASQRLNSRSGLAARTIARTGPRSTCEHAAVASRAGEQVPRIASAPSSAGGSRASRSCATGSRIRAPRPANGARCGVICRELARHSSRRRSLSCVERLTGSSKRSPPGARPRRRKAVGSASDRALSWRSVGAVLAGKCRPDERRAALGHPAEQLVDLEPEQRDEGLVAGIGQVRAPALAAGPEHAVLVDPDDGADRGALAPFEGARARSRSAGPRPCSASRAPASGLSGA